MHGEEKEGRAEGKDAGDETMIRRERDETCATLHLQHGSTAGLSEQKAVCSRQLERVECKLARRGGRWEREEEERKEKENNRLHNTHVDTAGGWQKYERGRSSFTRIQQYAASLQNTASCG